MKKEKLIKAIRGRLLFFMIALFISGVTAMPVETELQWAVAIVPEGTWAGDWLRRVQAGFTKSLGAYPFLMYGYDWLAFAHFVLAILFIGPYQKPVQNIWVVEFGLIACMLIHPFAFIMGVVRGIPFWWRLVDCSFGVVGFGVLWQVHRKMKTLSHIVK